MSLFVGRQKRWLSMFLGESVFEFLLGLVTANRVHCKLFSLSVFCVLNCYVRAYTGFQGVGGRAT